MEPTSTSFAMRDIREIGDRPLRVRSDTWQVDGHDSQIWRRLPWRKSLKLPSYARWPWSFSRAARRLSQANFYLPNRFTNSSHRPSQSLNNLSMRSVAWIVSFHESPTPRSFP